MKRNLILIFLMALWFGQGHAQEYKPTWESLDARPVTPWFSEAKFGIFIHWGPYSVPAKTPRGTYSEWYQLWLQNKTLFGNGKFTGTEVYDDHVKNYGPHYSYYNFGEQLKAEDFDPAVWAKLFKDAGAKYIVLTSKHHDGYCLWPSKEASQNWGFPWNSMEVGSHKDLVGELTDAVKQEGIKMGLYYSLMEWYHPWYNDKNIDCFVTDHFHPQFKDLVNSYQPDIVWTDGEWDRPAEQWRTPELLAWLFNESKAPRDVVINDRWGKGARHTHGGFYTTEYETGLLNDHPWEENRGMGFSFGYNRSEMAEDYNSPKSLVLLLTDIVCRGGNLLLDIGPDAHGRIPVIMEERLRQMGGWLAVNGEAIYGTTTWKNSYQWSEGKREVPKMGGHYTSGDYILKQTVDVPEGYATKEIFFTKKGDNLYAVVGKWPKKELVVKGVKPSKKTAVTLLGHSNPLNYRYEGGNLIISVPDLGPEELPCQYAWSFKISNIRK